MAKLSYLCGKKAMNDVKKWQIPGQFLLYDFTFEGVRHRGRIRLDEDTPGIEMLYDDQDIEITWSKRIRHKGVYMELCIVINDDAYDPDEGKVVASAWVSIYELKDRLHRAPIAQFEPDHWSYIDECNARNNVDRDSFYTM